MEQKKLKNHIIFYSILSKILITIAAFLTIGLYFYPYTNLGSIIISICIIIIGLSFALVGLNLNNYSEILKLKYDINEHLEILYNTIGKNNKRE